MKLLDLIEHLVADCEWHGDREITEGTTLFAQIEDALKRTRPIENDPQGLETPKPFDVLAAMRKLCPGADHGELIGFRELRRTTTLSKTEFDQLLLDLARKGKVSLHRHDFALSLNETERHILVTDGQGTFYVGVAIRQ